MTEPHPNVKANFLDKKGWIVSLCQFCTKISPTSDTHPLPCPWLMYTTIESVVVACAHFKMLDDCASHSSAKESSNIPGQCPFCNTHENNLFACYKSEQKLSCSYIKREEGCPILKSSDKVLDAKKEFLTKIIEKIRSEFTPCDDDEYYLSAEIFEDNVVDVLKQELEDEEELRTKEREQ